jgi:hypothetical protein
MIGTVLMMNLLRGLLAESAEGRAMAADSVVDLLKSYEPSEAAVVSIVLAWLAGNEADEVALEAQLHAISELAEHGLVPFAALESVSHLSRGQLRGSSLEYYEYLSSQLSPGPDGEPEEPG